MEKLHIVCIPVGPLATNCYLLWREGRNDCIAVDPGDQAEQIRRAAQGKRIAAVLLTHGHFDHIGAAQALAEEGAALYIHQADVPMLRDSHLNVSWMLHANVTVDAPVHPLQEGDQVEEAGITLAVLHTPGHTPGSVCYEAEGLLLTGDTMFDHGCGRTDLPGGSSADMLGSLRRLAPLRATHTIYGGHG